MYPYPFVCYKMYRKLYIPVLLFRYAVEHRAIIFYVNVLHYIFELGSSNILRYAYMVRNNVT